MDSTKKRKAFIERMKVENSEGRYLEDGVHQETIRSNVYVPNDVESRDLYTTFVKEQTDFFEDYINYLNKLLCILKDYRIVSDFTQFTARIKSVASALRNDGKKALNDIFGIEVDFATPEEQEFVQEIVKVTLNKTREVNHDKKNGYKAYHYSGYPEIENWPLRKSDDSLIVQKLLELLSRDNCLFSIPKAHLKILKEKIFQLEKSYKKETKLKIKLNKPSSKEYLPIIEGQFKTIQVAISANIGDASHVLYKGENSTDLQKLYDEGRITLDEIPTMWESYLKRDENCNIVSPTKLSSKKTLKRLYPSLITIDEPKSKEAGIK